VHLAIPALRDRGADVMVLANHFLALHAQRYGKPRLQLSTEALASLVRHRWPGNVRELRNVIKQAVLMASGPLVESINLEWLPTEVAEPGPSADAASVATLNLETLERDTLRRALEAARWNVSQAAKLLGVSRDTLRYRIEKFGLSFQQ
jgi:two-component system, NtrC family, response regulator AtoC